MLAWRAVRALAVTSVLAGCAARGGTTKPPDRAGARATTANAPIDRTPIVRAPVVDAPTEVVPEPETPATASTPPFLDGPAAPAAPTAAQRDALFASPEDPEPQVRGGIVKALEDVSYIVGNEWSLDAFRTSIADKGGGYVGVGPDQAYLFIGWQRPEFAWLIDYDPKVMRVHAMYRAMFEIAETRKEFLAAFDPASSDRISKLLVEYEDSKLRRMYRNNRDMFRWRLRTVERNLKRRGIASWLTDDATYTFVRDMVLGDRVRPLRVDLNETAGMAGIADAARKLGVTIRVVYLSNAEEYWDSYGDQFERNLAALPHDDASLVLRTRLVWHHNRDYIYNVQPLGVFLAWLAVPRVRTLEDILGEKIPSAKDAIDFVRSDALPPAAQIPRAASSLRSPTTGASGAAGLPRSAAASSTVAAQRNP